jgi:hypothetical protein
MASMGVAAPTKSTADERNKETLPTSEEIQSRAYQIYMERGGADGSALDDWLQAERELQQTTKPHQENAITDTK